jgi:glycosyltransferase involved in cell wall biosynthesis
LTIAECGIPSGRVHNTGWCVDTEFFQPAVNAHSASVIVSAGTAQRDYCTLVRAVESLTTDVKIAADSEWYPQPLDIAHSRLPSHVDARSYRTYVSLRELYAQAAVGVVPLNPTPFACGYAVVSELMAMGKPVVVTRTDTVGDFVVHGENGFYVAPHDADDLRDKLRYLLTYPDVAQRMGRNARARIEQLFSLGAYTDRLTNLIATTDER